MKLRKDEQKLVRAGSSTPLHILQLSWPHLPCTRFVSWPSRPQDLLLMMVPASRTPLPGSFSWQPVVPVVSFKCPIKACVQLCFHLELLQYVFMSFFLTTLWTSWAQQLMMMRKGSIFWAGNYTKCRMCIISFNPYKTLWGIYALSTLIL